MFAVVPWVRMSADVEPRPAVEAAVLDMRDVVGHEIVAERVALVDRYPDLTGRRMDGQAVRVANAGRDHPPAASSPGPVDLAVGFP